MAISSATSVDSQLLGVGGRGFSSADSAPNSSEQFRAQNEANDSPVGGETRARDQAQKRAFDAVTALAGREQGIKSKLADTTKQTAEVAANAATSWALQDVVTGQLSALVLTTFFEPLTTLLNLATLNFEWGFAAITGRAELPMWQKLAIAVADVLIPVIYLLVVLIALTTIDCAVTSFIGIFRLLLGGSVFGLCQQ